MKRVLFVSYVFPPMGAVGGRRVVDFCKYLPRHGWQPVVLTVKSGSTASWDENQLRKIPDTIVVRTSTFEPLLKDLASPERRQKLYIPGVEPSGSSAPDAKLSAFKRLKKTIRTCLRVPDENNFWILMGLPGGLRAIRREKIDAIVSSSPPVSAHVLASLLSRLTGKPHIVDFRDLWTLNHTYQYRGLSRGLKRVDAFLERSVLSRAGAITTATNGFERQMKSHLKGSLADRVTTITNGFDYEEIDLERKIEAGSRDRFRILYTGSLYSDFNPVFFLESVNAWLKERGIDRNTVQIDFYGQSEYDYSKWLDSLGLGEIVRFHGFRPRAELASAFDKADCLLLLLSFKPQHANVIPAKLFDYLAAPAPVLALTPPGTTGNLIAEHRAGTVVTQPDTGLMIAVLDQLYNDWRSRPATPRQYRYIEQIDRNHLAGLLAAELNRVTTV